MISKEPLTSIDTTFSLVLKIVWNQHFKHITPFCKKKPTTWMNWGDANNGVYQYLLSEGYQSVDVCSSFACSYFFPEYLLRVLSYETSEWLYNIQQSLRYQRIISRVANTPSKSIAAKTATAIRITKRTTASISTEVLHNLQYRYRKNSNQISTEQHEIETDRKLKVRNTVATTTTGISRGKKGLR